MGDPWITPPPGTQRWSTLTLEQAGNMSQVQCVPMSPTQDLPGPGRGALASVVPWRQSLPLLPLVSLGCPMSQPSLLRAQAAGPPCQACPYPSWTESQPCPQQREFCGLDPGTPAGSQDKGWGWGLADPAYLVINIYQSSGARACSWLGVGGVGG